MPAYVIVDIHITDPVRYEEYKKLAAPTIAAFDGRYMVRGGAVTKLEGGRTPGRLVVLEFPTAARATEWWGSDTYAPAKALRQASASAEMILVEGV